MARNFGKIEVAIWKSPKFRALTDDAKMLYLYLVACPHGNALGCFILDPEYVQADLRWVSERVSTCMSELVSKGMIERDPENYLTFLVGWWGHNSVENGFVAKAAIKTLAALPKCSVLDNAINAIDASKDKFSDTAKAEFAHLYMYASKDRSKTPLQTKPQTKEPEPEREIEKEKEGAQERASSPKGTRLPVDWQPSAEDRAYGAELGLLPDEIDAEAAEFRQYFHGADAAKPVKKSWPQAWQRWVRGNAAQRMRKRPRQFGQARAEQYTAPVAPDDRLWMMRLAGFDKTGHWLGDWGDEPPAIGEPPTSGCLVPPQCLALRAQARSTAQPPTPVTTPTNIQPFDPERDRPEFLTRRAM